MLSIAAEHPVGSLEGYKKIHVEAKFALCLQLERLVEYDLGQIVYMSMAGMWRTALSTPLLCDDKFSLSLTKGANSPLQRNNLK